MKITVILCTYNRCQKLAQALKSVVTSALPDGVEWEVLVVDNNSSDQTRQVVDDFCLQYPCRIRYLFEPRQGKSQALNSGVREAAGEILAFLDDDVTVDPRWLWNLTAPLRKGKWSGSGGRTIQAHSFKPPHWLAIDGPYSMLGPVCASFDLGDHPCELDRAPYGTNMAYRKKMFDKYGGFRTDLGPSSDKRIPRPNEDTEFGRRLLAAGERLRYEPSAVVYHPVPQNRLRKNYLLAWWFDLGRARVREWERGPDVWGIPRPYLSILSAVAKRAVPATMRWMLTLDLQKRFSLKCYLWATFGEIKELIAWRRTKLARAR